MLAALAVVLANAHVLTQAPARPRATTVAVVDGKIAYVGDDLGSARKAAGPGAELIDLGGRTLIPGFDDAHVHFGLSLTIGSDHGIDVPEGGKKAFLEAVKRASERLADGKWLFVKTRTLPDGLRTTRDLDFCDRPLFVVTSRGGLFNSRGLKQSGFGAQEAPRGFVRGRELAAALDRLVKSLPIGVLTDGARAFLRTLAQHGITSVQLIDEMPELFERLRAHGELTARIRMVPLGYRFETRLYEPNWAAPHPEWVRVDGVKYFHDDGARITRFELEEIYARNVAAGRRVLVHVLSRRALDTLLDALERLGRAPSTFGPSLFRIEHADEVSPEQAARLAKLAIMVCPNPSMLPEWRKDAAFPMRTLLSAGVRLCIGTDYVGEHLPPRPISPLKTLELAATHGGFGEAERISAAEALEAYTLGSAAAEGLSALKGSIEPGKLADLVVLSEDPLRAEPARIGEIEVLMTMVDGKIVYRGGDLAQFAPRTGPPPTIGPRTIPPPSIGQPKKR